MSTQSQRFVLLINKLEALYQRLDRMLPPSTRGEVKAEIKGTIQQILNILKGELK